MVIEQLSFEAKMDSRSSISKSDPSQLNLPLSKRFPFKKIECRYP